ncbi:hypothetical protein [Lysobacter sp. Hz 25]|uniref:hypothetical protein n=1 Tax=Lysobacter sp. Hz 25 TaxID=3383698 RepID=UPI0038D4EAF1
MQVADEMRICAAVVGGAGRDAFALRLRLAHGPVGTEAAVEHAVAQLPHALQAQAGGTGVFVVLGQKEADQRWRQACVVGDFV